MKQFFTFYLIFFATIVCKSQGSGDVGVLYHLSETTAHGTAGDRLGLVLLIPFTSGMSVNLTENGCNGTQLDTDEGIITIQATTAHAAGKVVNITLNAGALVSGTAGFSYTFSGGGYAASTGGDQSIVYAGGESSPTFIYTANFNGLGLWSTCTNGAYPNECGADQCEDPGGESFAYGANGTTEWDCNYYSGTTPFANKADALAKLKNSANWSGTDTPASAETAADNFAPNLFTPLPVSWANIYVFNEKNGNKLVWQTASEANNDYFEIERSTEDFEFVTIGKVEGSGNKSKTTNYEYTDESVKAGTTYYYRIKQVDYDGQQDFSSVVSITVKGFSLGIILSPNPVQNEVKIDLGAALESSIVLDVISFDGKVVKTMIVEPGEYFKMLDLSTFPDGLYFLKSKGSEVINQKFLKNASQY